MTHHIQGSPDWHDFRKDKIGGSDAASCLNLKDAFHTRYELWEIKMGLRTVPSNPAMERGRLLEEPARALYESITGTVTFQSVLIHPIFDWKIGSFDGITMEKDKAVEIKCPGENVYEKILKEGVPSHYYAQCQHLMDVADLKDIDFFAYRSDMEFHLIKVERDQDYIDKLHRAEEEFMSYLLTSCPPPFGDFDYRKPESEEFFYLEKEFESLYVESKIVEKKLEQVKDKLKELSNDKPTKGNSVIVYPSFRSTVDYSSMIKDFDIDVEKYKKKSKPSWTVKYVG